MDTTKFENFLKQSKAEFKSALQSLLISQEYLPRLKNPNCTLSEKLKLDKLILAVQQNTNMEDFTLGAKCNFDNMMVNK